jgi:hypothetical protein
MVSTSIGITLVSLRSGDLGVEAAVQTVVDLERFKMVL